MSTSFLPLKGVSTTKTSSAAHTNHDQFWASGREPKDGAGAGSSVWAARGLDEDIYGARLQ